MAFVKPISRTRRIAMLAVGIIPLVAAAVLQGLKSDSEERKQSIQAEAQRRYRSEVGRIDETVSRIPPWMRDGREGIPERARASEP